MTASLSGKPYEEQVKIGDKMLRNFLWTFAVAFVAELALRAFPTFLEGSVERQWIEWMLVSLMGVSAYLLWAIAFWYKKESANFADYRPWYRATAARGPVIALVVLIALTNISFQVQIPSVEEGASTATTAAGGDQSDESAPLTFGIDFQNASETVLLVAAFIIGFFSRLAKALLESIARFIFGDLFDRTYPKSELTGSGEGG
jgi:hypothetical protein